jgi:hypothetical protein
VSRKIPEDVREKVRRRAHFLCEYCHTNERWQYVRFTIDHIIPNDDDSLENLALACFHCNRRKSNKTFVYDESGKEISLFNPRTDFWKDHFAWSEDKITIIAKTETGQITIDLLELNRERILQIRLADVAVKRHPPD